ncbi:MAG: VCBS repeat-containing protein, partial [Bacteroidetes bacterium]|nr:VCBS repeat-containing protein [Bacteroidota bacterium]
QDVSLFAGLADTDTTYRSMGCAWGDYDRDGYVDLALVRHMDESDIDAIRNRDFAGLVRPMALYHNNGDGTFTNQINNYVKHISNFGMGIDLADINNDGLLDILVLDMMAEDNYRQKTNMSAMDAERFWYLVDNGYHYQYMRNTLQLNNGNGTFSEIGQFAGINNTDWSWSALMADYDNDGFKDIFITNGYRRDSKNVDATAIIDKMIADNNGVMPKESFIEMLDILPSVKLSNYFFRNNGDLTFSNLTGPVGLDEPSFSNGAAHGDLDNDGDLDIVVNNILDKAFVFENIINDYEGGNYLRIKLIGISPNISGAGTRITLVAENDEIQFQEFSVTKGFQSCVEHYVHFGVGDAEKIKEIRILWPDDRMQIFSDVDVNQVLQANQIDANEDWDDSSIPNKTLFTEITSQTGIDFTHEENTYDDYVKESLLPHKMSQFGPCIATGDVNGDGLEDFYVGGAAGQAGRLYINNGSSSFSHAAIQPFENEKKCEDIGSLFFDADGDGDLDLYVVSGGNEFEVSSDLLQDRLYLNDNAGNFSLSADALPEMLTSGSCVVASDYDNDGDLDLFVGGRVVPGKYAFPVFSYILNNDNGKFSNVTENVAPDLIKPGMVTSAVWTDFDNDGDDDLIVVGEWMPISLYENDNGKFKDVTFDKGMETTTGWWNKIVSADFDGDGDMDYMLGNLGLNYKYKATVEEPLHLYCHDFDNSGTIDIVLGYYNHGECFPVRGRECTSGQIPMIKEKFKNYDSYGSATLEDVYGDLLQSSLQHHTAQMFESIYMQNNGDGSFELIALPVQAQFSTVFGIIPEDFDNDGHLDVVLAGNFYVSEVETGRADAGIGLFMRGDGKGNFEPKTVSESGFFTPLDVRNLEMLVDDNGDRIILVGNNDDAMQIIKVNGTKQIN